MGVDEDDELIDSGEVAERGSFGSPESFICRSRVRDGEPPGLGGRSTRSGGCGLRCGHCLCVQLRGARFASDPYKSLKSTKALLKIQVYQINVVPESSHEFSVNEEEILRLNSANRDVDVGVSAWIVLFPRTEKIDLFASNRFQIYNGSLEIGAELLHVATTGAVEPDQPTAASTVATCKATTLPLTAPPTIVFCEPI